MFLCNIFRCRNKQMVQFKRLIREFEKIRTKKTHYKNYFQKIIQNRNSIKTLATKTNNLYNDFIEFMDLSNWDRNMIVSYK